MNTLARAGCRQPAGKRWIPGLLVLLALLYGLHLVKIDADPAPWGVASFQPMDEGQYATMALTKLNYGTCRPDGRLEDAAFETEYHMRNSIFMNLFVYAGLRVFGDTYTGLRSASVLFGFFNLLFLLLCCGRLAGGSKAAPHGRLLCAGLCLLFVFDFMSDMASRICEPSVFRQFFVLLAIYTLLPRERGAGLRYGFAGFCSILSVFGLYITNIFLPAGVFAAILAGKSGGRKEKGMRAAVFILGGMAAFALCDLYYRIVWDSSCISNTIGIIRSFQGAAGYAGDTGAAHPVLFAVRSILTCNSITYELPVCLLLLLSLPGYCRQAFQRREEQDILLLAVSGLYIVQTLFNNDYVVRKFVIVFPVLLLMVMRMEICGIKPSKWMCPAAFAAAGYVCWYRCFPQAGEAALDFAAGDKAAVLFGAVSGCVLCLIRMKIKTRRAAMAAAICAGMLVNLHFCGSYICSADSYTEKEIMRALEETVGNDYVYGVYSIGFTLYNHILPVVNQNVSLDEQMAQRSFSWYLDYSSFSFPRAIRENPYGMIWEESITYPRSFSVYGNRKGVSLYKTAGAAG